jgi:putative phosphoribosyl transferase
MFTDRSDAAHQLAAALRRRDVVGDVVVALAPAFHGSTAR